MKTFESRKNVTNWPLKMNKPMMHNTLCVDYKGKLRYYNIFNCVKKGIISKYPIKFHIYMKDL